MDDGVQQVRFPGAGVAVKQERVMSYAEMICYFSGGSKKDAGDRSCDKVSNSPVGIEI